jgi:hypothetical protein
MVAMVLAASMTALAAGFSLARATSLQAAARESRKG